MSVAPVASYFSATASVGKTPPPRTVTYGATSASYYSNPDRVSIGRTNGPDNADRVQNATFYTRRNVPPVTNRGEAGSAYRTQETIAALEKETSLSPFRIKLDIGDDRSLNNQDSFFINLKSRLGRLNDRLSSLGARDDFNSSVAHSTNPSVVTATPTTGARNATYTIEVTRLATAHAITSDKQSNTDAALGFSGSFSVNGYSVSVVTTDTLISLRDKINKGEDQNKNGLLDKYSEDTNGNGKLDIIYHGGVYAGDGRYLPGFAYNEDRNLNATLDTSEDVNNNNALDGGSKRIAAEATIEDGRLTITSLRGGDTELALTDGGNILESLGFYQRDSNGNKKVLRDASHSTYNTDPVTANFSVDGTDYTTDSNHINSVIENVVLTLTGLSNGNTAKVTITRDATAATNKVSAFVSSFNDVIRLINKTNLADSPVRENVRVQDLTLSLARDASQKVASLPYHPNSLRDIGVIPSASLPGGIDIATLDGLRQSFSQRQNNGPDGLLKTNEAQSHVAQMGKLNRLGVTSEADFTLTIDREKVKKALTDNPVALYNVFNNAPDGVGRRLHKTISNALAEPNGIIAFQRNRLSGFRKNGAAQDILARSTDSLSIKISANAASRLFSSVENNITGRAVDLVAR